jgi:hypothetical protein
MSSLLEDGKGLRQKWSQKLRVDEEWLIPGVCMHYAIWHWFRTGMQNLRACLIKNDVRNKTL